MSEQTDNILHLIKPYGLSEEEGKIYAFLLSQGVSTALTLSRQLHLGRTKVYRLLDKLKAKQLVEQHIDHRGMRFGATNPQKFSQLIQEEKQRVKALEQSLPQLVSSLQQLLPIQSRESKVLYYSGEEGLKQVSYNITRAKGLLRVFEMEHLSAFTDEEFSEHIRELLVENKIHTRDLTNKTAFPGFTQIKELIKNFSIFKHIDPKLLKIDFEVLIYNDVYATYTYKDKEVFCVEIYNSQLASMQKQIFDFIWQQAKPMRFVDDFGGAELVEPIDPRQKDAHSV